MDDDGQPLCQSAQKPPLQHAGQADGAAHCSALDNGVGLLSLQAKIARAGSVAAGFCLGVFQKGHSNLRLQYQSTVKEETYIPNHIATNLVIDAFDEYSGEERLLVVVARGGRALHRYAARDQTRSRHLKLNAHQPLDSDIYDK